MMRASAIVVSSSKPAASHEALLIMCALQKFRRNPSTGPGHEKADEIASPLGISAFDRNGHQQVPEGSWTLLARPAAILNSSQVRSFPDDDNQLPGPRL